MSPPRPGRHRGRPRSIALWHPFTARSIGWADDASLRVVHSRPHLAALRALTRDEGAQCRVEYLTDRLLPTVTRGDPGYRFWPRTTRWRRAAAKFRWEWSTPALVATALFPADVTIINMSGHGSSLSRALAHALRGRHRPYIAMVGGFHATLTGPQLRYYRRAAVVAVHNHDLAERLAVAGVPGAVVVPLGVDPGRFSPGPPRTGATVLYVGRFAEWKGLHHLVAALPAMQRACPEVQVRLVGPGFDSPYAERLRADADAAGVGGALRIEPSLPYDDLPDLYRSAAVFVLPSEDEGFGMVVLEAMACGLPVVALDRPGGPRDLITDGVDGLLTAPDDLGPAVGGLLADPARLRAMGDAAAATVMDRYTTDVTNRAFADLVDRAVGTT